jgi:hypothetical protein
MRGRHVDKCEIGEGAAGAAILYRRSFTRRQTYLGPNIWRREVKRPIWAGGTSHIATETRHGAAVPPHFQANVAK